MATGRRVDEDPGGLRCGCVEHVRRSARAPRGARSGLAYSAFAGTELSLPIDLDAADVVLVGPHLAHALERIERDAARRGTTVVLLPPDIFTDLDGTRTLALVREAVADPGEPPRAADAAPADTDARQEED